MKHVTARYQNVTFAKVQNKNYEIKRCNRAEELTQQYVSKQNVNLYST